MKLIDCYTELLAYMAYLTGDPSAAAVSYEDASKKFDELCGRAETIRTQAKISDDDWRQGLFAIAALIDEMVLCSPWPGKAAWQVSQLQHRFFNTTNAGVEFFEHLNALGPGREEIRQVYDWCLAMGFKGTYFRPEDTAALDDITRLNMGLAGTSRPGEETMLMFPEAYGADRRDRPKSRLATFLITALLGIIPVVIFVVLFVFYSNVLKGVLAGYFQ